jgi:hypothetical protein
LAETYSARPLVVQTGMLGSDGRVVESGRDGVGEGDLSAGVYVGDLRRGRRRTEPR